MSGWLLVVLLVAALVACVVYLVWALAEVFTAVLRRGELQRLQVGVLERLAASGAEDARLSELRRLHDIADGRLRRVGGQAPSLRDSLEAALYQRTTQAESVRRQLGGRRLPSVATITRLIERLEEDSTYDAGDGQTRAVDTSKPQPPVTSDWQPDDVNAGGRSHGYRKLTPEQRTQVGVAVLSLSGAFLLSTLIAIASHSFTWSSPAAIGLLGTSAVLLLVAFGTLGNIDVRVVAIGSATLVALAFGTGFIIVGPSQGRGSHHHLSGPYFIGGTCADGVCKLRQHVESDVASSYGGAPLLPDGTKVYIRCQMVGGVVRLHRRGHESNESNVWDLLEDGRYVSDLFVNTSKHGELDASIPRCSR